MTTTAAIALVSGVAVVYAALLGLVNDAVQEPYMDEIFHIPQAQHYCLGRFDVWDPKITTFPGVYLAGVLHAKAASFIGSGEDAAFCSMAVLRSVNVLFGIGNVWLIIALRSRLTRNDRHPVLHSAMIAAFPILFFFSFLYYTDAGATFFVLLMYLLAIRIDVDTGSISALAFLPSAMAGGLAVLFRQTNIIWVLFVAGTTLVRIVEATDGAFIYGCSRQDEKKTRSIVVHNSFGQVFLNFVRVVFSQLVRVTGILWPFVSVVSAFVGFLVWNGGIVVGDKSNHEAGFHGAQILYFIFVASSGFGLGQFTPNHIRNFFALIRRNSASLVGVAFMVSVVFVLMVVIHKFSPVHKFMLADNRHYTFYIWRKFFLKHSLAKFLPSALYLFQGWRCWQELRRTRTPLWMIVYVVAVVLVLVPSPLVEPRYYLIPFVLLHLHIDEQQPVHLALTTLAYTFVNGVTLYIFLYRPYQWVDGTTARFMW